MIGAVRADEPTRRSPKRRGATDKPAHPPPRQKKRGGMVAPPQMFHVKHLYAHPLLHLRWRTDRGALSHGYAAGLAVEHLADECGAAACDALERFRERGGFLGRDGHQQAA